MQYSLETAPATGFLDLAGTKAHLRVDHDDEDAFIQSLMTAAEAWLDADHGVLGRAIVTQDWALECEAPTERSMSLPFPRAQSVVSVSYFDKADQARTMDVSNFRIIGDDQAASVELVAGAEWPGMADRPDALKIVYRAGYGTDNDVPAPIKVAALLLVGVWYENREASVDRSMSDLPYGVQALLANFRVARGHF